MMYNILQPHLEVPTERYEGDDEGTDPREVSQPAGEDPADRVRDSNDRDQEGGVHSVDSLGGGQGGEEHVGDVEALGGE